MKGSWKTTVMGLVAMVCGTVLAVVAVAHGKLDAQTLTMLIMAFATGGVGLFARDNDKRSEDVGADRTKIRDHNWQTLPLVLAGALGLGLGGCATGPDRDAEVARLATLAELAAYTGTSVYLMEHPEERAKFEAAAETLSGLIRDEQWDPVAFRQALYGLPIRELKSQEARIMIDSALILYDGLAARYVDLGQVDQLKPVVVGVRNGVSRAVNVQRLKS